MTIKQRKWEGIKNARSKDEGEKERPNKAEEMRKDKEWEYERKDERREKKRVKKITREEREERQRRRDDVSGRRKNGD